MTENTALKIILALYYFIISFVIFYSVDLVFQSFTTSNEIDWTKYMGSAFSYAIALTFGVMHGWDVCKEWHEGN